MSRLVVVSNRVAPVKGKATAGGLAVAVLAALRASGGLWFGWSGEVSQSPTTTPALFHVGRVTYALVDLSTEDYDEYYNGFANRCLWPLFHYRADLASFDRRFYAGHLRVNAMMARELAPLLEADDLVWVHDFHLISLGQELRRLGSRHRIGFFLHIPFPAAEVLTVLPSHREIVAALFAYDLVGFQTSDSLRAFHDYVVNEAGGTVGRDGFVRAFGRSVRAAAFPIGIDTRDFAAMATSPGAQRHQQRLAASLAGRDMIIGVDRLDYTKGLVERMLAFERLLERFPGVRGRVSMMQIAPPSRSEVPEYIDIRRQLETTAGHINGRFAEFDWVPLRYLNKAFSRRALSGLFRSSRIGLVTPFRDGMNLVAKEFVAAQNPEDPGVLVLSRFAGAAHELTEGLIVNPFDTDGVAEALARGLEMPRAERKARWRPMMKHLLANDVDAWRARFLEALEAARRVA